MKIVELYKGELKGKLLLDKEKSLSKQPLRQNFIGYGILNLNIRLHTLFYTIFLPKGYPKSVSSDYLTYQFWDSAQAFSSSICGTLSTRAILTGLGVGDPFATPLGATFNWVLKNGAGMAGGIGFAVFAGERLDSNLKQWRIFADIANDSALFLEMLAPYVASTLSFTLILRYLRHYTYHFTLNIASHAKRLIQFSCLYALHWLHVDNLVSRPYTPKGVIAWLNAHGICHFNLTVNNDTTLFYDEFSSFLELFKLPPMLNLPTEASTPKTVVRMINWPLIVLLCASSIGKACVGVAGSATRAALIQHQARANNSADVAAKDGSQETLVNLLALLAVVFVVIPFLDYTERGGSSQFIGTWVCFIILVAFHIYANYRAVKAVVVCKVNLRRAKLLITAFLDQLFVKSIHKYKTPGELNYTLMDENIHRLIADEANNTSPFSPECINNRENLSWSRDDMLYPYSKTRIYTPGFEKYVKIGIKTSDIIKTDEELQLYTKLYQLDNEKNCSFKYILTVRPFKTTFLQRLLSRLKTSAQELLITLLCFVLYIPLSFYILLTDQLNRNICDIIRTGLGFTNYPPIGTFLYSIGIALHKTAEARDILMALFQTECLLAISTFRHCKANNPNAHLSNGTLNGMQNIVLNESADLTLKYFDTFYNYTRDKHGWDYTNVMIDSDEWRYETE